MEEDKFSWLRDKNWPAVNDKNILNFLNEENNYFHQVMDPHESLKKEIYDELSARIKQEDASYPIKIDQYQYFSRNIKDKDYPVFIRKIDDQEQILLDANALSVGKSSFALGDVSPSNDHRKLAYSYDSDGSERFLINITDLESEKLYEYQIRNTIGNIIWNKDSSGFFYIQLDENWRTNKVFFHQLNTSPENDILIYQENDPSFHLDIEVTASKKFLIINCRTGSNNEVYLVNTQDFSKKLILARKKDQIYDVDHINDEFYISINDKGRNFRLVKINENHEIKYENLIELIPHSGEEYIENFALYNDFLVLNKKIKGLSYIYCYQLNDFKLYDKLNFKDEIYEAGIIFTTKDDKFLRISYSSLVKPKSILEYEFASKSLFTRKTDEILGYNEDEYQCTRIWAKASDGVEIPISLVFRKNIDKDARLLLYAYGSYGIGTSASFRSNIISLLDRGFIYAIAHVRGGDELGFTWYESAKFLQKKTTFHDFIACAEHLINEKYANKLAIMGGSAGGMLVGAVLNMRPELFKSAVALVPFVDVLNTMLDDSLPLTPPEFQEWGNPKEKIYFDYIKSYCPYSNVEQKHYPNLLVTAGLTDPRVGYWEAAKWVAKLKENKQDNNVLLLKTEMDSGHKGQSGRFKGLEEVAMIYSFLINYT